MRLIVQDCPPSLNKVMRFHWTKRQGLLNAWIMLVRVGFGHRRKPMGKQKVKITLFHSRLFDVDNAYGSCKVIFDAMKAERLIVDDSPQWLEATVEQEKCKRKECHTVIEMEAI